MNFVFLSLIFENNFFKFFIQYKYLKNLQYVCFENIEVIKTLKFFSEVRPIQLTDMCTFDSFYLKEIDHKFFNTVNIIYNMSSYKLDCYKLFIFCSYNYISVNEMFKNSIWLEREQTEFFGAFFKNQYDTRNLLLEYNFDKHIFLKKYNVTDNDNIISKYYYKVNFDKNTYNSI